MDITAAICTWNRVTLLDVTLAEMHRLCVPEGVAWELLVVDNTCTDDTATVIGKYVAEGVLPIRRLFEGKAGLSNARHCALGAGKGT